MALSVHLRAIFVRRTILVYFAKLVQEKYQNIDELISDIKIKNFSTEKELKDELVKKSKSNPWMGRVVNYLFEW